MVEHCASLSVLSDLLMFVSVLATYGNATVEWIINEKNHHIDRYFDDGELIHSYVHTYLS